MVRGLVLVVVVGCSALGCRTESFECESDNACRIESIQGSCEPSGYCSFPDEECSSGRRYGENAPSEVAGVCVGGASEGSTGVTPMTTTLLTSATTGPTTTTTPGSTSVFETGSTSADASSGTSSEPPDANTVFVSSEAVPLEGDFVANADALCNELAGDAGLPGGYVAWLSTPTTSALERLSGARGWTRPDLLPFVDRTADLSQGLLYYPPVLDETGSELRVSDIITGTGEDGDAAAGTCADWTDFGDSLVTTAGRSGSMWPDWTRDTNVACAMTSSRVYCFGTDLDITLDVEPTAGRLAFVTVTELNGGERLDGFDGLCQQEADAAGLEGVFLSVVATSSGSAFSRFEMAGTPWVNAMGVPLAPTAAALSVAVTWDTSPSFSASGAPLDGRFWTGAQSLSGGAGGNCNDWTDVGGSGITHATSLTDSWQEDGISACASPNRVLCFER